MNILFIVDTVSLGYGGEAEIAYRYLENIAKSSHKVYLVSHISQNKYLDTDLRKNISEYYIQDSIIHTILRRFNFMVPYRIYSLILNQLFHLITSYKSRKVVKKIIKNNDIDIIYKPNSIAVLGVSFLYNLKIPVVFGPLSGGMTFPENYKHFDSFYTRSAIEISRKFALFLQNIFPAKKNAALIFYANDRSKKMLESFTKTKLVYLNESGVDLKLFSNHNLKSNTGATNFLFTGSLVDWKNVDTLIKAFSKVSNEINAHLHIVGAGPEGRKLKKIVQDLGISEKVTFHGRLDKKDLIKIFTISDIFVMPSIRESGGASVLEAMAYGLPVISVNWGGPAEYLKNDCGVLLEPDSDLEGNMAKAMLSLAKDTDLRLKFSNNAKQKIITECYSWKDKTDKVLSVLQKVVDEHRE